MLRISRDGKPVSLKEQEKLVNVKGSTENVNPAVKFDKPAQKARPKHPGLRPLGKEKKADAKPKEAEKK